MEDIINGNISIKLDSTYEWGPGYFTKLNGICNSRYDVITAQIKISTEHIENEGMLVMELKKDDKSIFWTAGELKNYCDLKKGVQDLYVSAEMIDIFKSADEMKDVQLNIFFWNNKKKTLMLDDFSITVKEGNPLKYGLFEKIEE